jgi:hypothetical protein
MSTFTHYTNNISNTVHIYQWYDQVELVDIIKRIQNGEFNNTHIIHWGPEEWTFASCINEDSVLELRDALEQAQAFITFVTGAHRNVYGADDMDRLSIKWADTEPTIHQLEYFIARVDVVCWPSYFMWLTAHNYLEVSRNNELNEFQASVANDIANNTPTHLWTTMIGECWYHRHRALDIMAEQGVMPLGKVILNNTKQQYPDFQHWDKSNMVRTAGNGTVDQYGVWPQEYTNGLIDVVMESTIRARFSTEKTWRPVFYGKPMVILGARNANAAFQELMGGWPLDQFINFDWDQYRHYEDRVKGLCEQLHEFNEKQFVGKERDCKFMLRNMTDSAKNHIQNVIRQRGFIPDFVMKYPECGLPGRKLVFKDKEYSGYAGQIDFVTDFSWHRKQQIANQQSAITGEDINSQGVPWLL